MSERNLETLLRRVHGKTEAMGCSMNYRTFVDTALAGWIGYKRKAFVTVEPVGDGRVAREKIYCLVSWDTVKELRRLCQAATRPFIANQSEEADLLLGSKTYVGCPIIEVMTEEERQDLALMVYERVLAARSLGLTLLDDAHVTKVIKNIHRFFERPQEVDTYRYTEDVAVSDVSNSENDSVDDSPATPSGKRKKADQ